MAKIKVICTSTGCIEYAPERYRKHDIDIIHILVNFKGVEYHDGLDLDPAKFYAELETLENPKDNLPRTAIPPRAEVEACFERAISEGYDEAIVVALSSYLGGTYNFIRLVAKDFEDRLKVHVVDAKITSFGEGLLAIQAAELAAKGADSTSILKELEWSIAHQELFGVDAKLDYLIYNGRLKGGKALMGKMLNICPVVHFNKEGELCALQSVRTPKKALTRTCEILKEMLGDRDSADYILFHVYTGPSLLEDLKEIEKKYDIVTNHEPVIFSPVAGAHNGPWMAGYGLLFLRREDEPLT